MAVRSACHTGQEQRQPREMGAARVGAGSGGEVIHHVLTYKQVPTKLTVGWQQRSHGSQHSRTTPLPASIFAAVTESSEIRGELRGGTAYLMSGRSDPDIISPETLIVDTVEDMQRLCSLDTPYARRVAAVVDVSASLIHAWKQVLPQDTSLYGIGASARHEALATHTNRARLRGATAAALHGLVGSDGSGG
eukprot:CAMPEP_0181244810 /NCGR_PEP_ID=MMETSP1096-20121128/43071_1 /TAXON_ID=156174 ORGANISM="Chrysochromulina ericina, Strain CCMP281" /NCGR_SAMPLE_ID=MMETSP1096 /ASSEMBLY_ACC=CAM_ASM_000453 /LENGTH=191 /DNA_ID=CAMNT_0023341409 /DNA_START=77 /DNA_END=650 /DNA_ORIENTATION=+